MQRVAQGPVVWAVSDIILDLLEEYPAADELAEAINERLERRKGLSASIPTRSQPGNGLLEQTLAEV